MRAETRFLTQAGTQEAMRLNNELDICRNQLAFQLMRKRYMVAVPLVQPAPLARVLAWRI